MSQLQDLTALIRANTPLIVIETRDEERVVELFRQSLMQVWRALHRWTITEGLRRLDLDREDAAEGPPDASSVLRAIQEADQRGIYLLLDFHPYLGYASHQRLLRDIVQRRGCQPHVLVLVGATIVGSMATVWHGIVNPPRSGALRDWRYDAPGQAPILLKQGEEMGRFLLGSTVVMLFPQGPLQFNPQWSPTRPIQLGEAMAQRSGG